MRGARLGQPSQTAQGESVKVDGALTINNLAPRRAGVRVSLGQALAFLLVGGASWILLFVFVLLSVPRVVMNDHVRLLMQEVSSLGLMFVLLFSYPHFVFSYRFAYMQGRAFIAKNPLQLIVYPLVVAGLLAVAALFWNYPVERLTWLIVFDRDLQAIGIDARWSQYRGLGELVLASLLILQMFMSGYHYCMQGLGVALTLGQDRGYRLDELQKRALKFNLWALWGMNFFSGYSFLSLFDRPDFAYHAPQFPPLLGWLCQAAFLTSVLVLLWLIVRPALKRSASLPPLLFWVPILSLWIWLQPFFQPYGYQFWVVPIAHGAQYLYCSYRVETNKFDALFAHKFMRGKLLQLFFYAALCAVTVWFGYMMFIYLPGCLDQSRPVAASNFFFLAAFVFFSTHHYLLDSVAWKQDSRARRLLCKQAVDVSPGQMRA